jgi:hypothetical protein
VPTKAKSTTPLSEDAIRHRAYLLWEADGRPDGMADHYWMKASQPEDLSVKQKVKAVAAKTVAALKSVKPKGKAAAAEPSPAKAKAPAKAPKLKAAAAKLATPAVKAKPAAKAPAKKPAAKAAAKKA